MAEMINLTSNLEEKEHTQCTFCSSVE